MGERTPYETRPQNQTFWPKSSTKQFVWLILCVLLSSCTSQDLPPSESRSPTNLPPSIKAVQILPRTVTADDLLSVFVEADDPDRNRLTFKHRWFVNDNLMTETPTLLAGSLKQGDRVAVEIVASDGTVESSPVRTQPSVVVNAPPSHNSGAY